LRGLEEQDGAAAGWDVVAAEDGEEALELLEPAGAAVVGVEVHGAAVDARFDAVGGARDEGGVALVGYWPRGLLFFARFVATSGDGGR